MGNMRQRRRLICGTQKVKSILEKQEDIDLELTSQCLDMISQFFLASAHVWREKRDESMMKVLRRLRLILLL